MDIYGLSSPDLFRIDDLLDFSNANEDIFTTSSSSNAASSSFPAENSFNHHLPSATLSSSPFLTDLCVPSDDAAHLEWLSQFVDDSFSDFPTNPLGIGALNVKPDTSFTGKPRSKRSRIPAGNWTPTTELAAGKSKPKNEGGSGRHHSDATAGVMAEGSVRRCTHCASEKTPQWRTGPLGPKTLCNACGVRFKSGRLVPEYRPASSPTFVLTQHSNSHRKVTELRRQKELMRQQQQLQQLQQQAFQTQTQ